MLFLFLVELVALAPLVAAVVELAAFVKVAAKLASFITANVLFR